MHTPLRHFICGRTRVISVFLPRRRHNPSGCLVDRHSHTSLCRVQPPRATNSGTHFADLKNISQLKKISQTPQLERKPTEAGATSSRVVTLFSKECADLSGPPWANCFPTWVRHISHPRTGGSPAEYKGSLHIFAPCSERMKEWLKRSP